MKILVFSDSHGRVEPMVDAVELYRPDVAFHLGDVVRDAEKLRLACPKLDLRQVAGNCDWGRTDYETEGVARLEGKTVFYFHGHTAGVKLGPGQAVSRARSVGADILLFGHTHRPFHERYDDGRLLAVNPGAIQDGRCALLMWDGAGEITYIPIEG